MEPEQQPVVLYVTNIHLDLTEEDLQMIFERVGRVIKVSIPPFSAEKAAIYGTHVGFVTMDSMRDAHAAVGKLNGLIVEGKALTVKFKLSKDELLMRKRERHHETRKAKFQRLPLSEEDENIAPVPGHYMTYSEGVLDSSEILRTSDHHLSPYGQQPPDKGPLTITVQKDQGGRRVQNPVRRVQMFDPGDVSPDMYSALGHPLATVSTTAAAFGRDEGIDFCANCGKRAGLRCKACKITYYCSAVCMQMHWPMHRQVCVYEQRTSTEEDFITRVTAPSLMRPSGFHSSDAAIRRKTFLVNRQEMPTNGTRPDSAISFSARQPARQHQFSGVDHRNSHRMPQASSVPSLNHDHWMSRGEQERSSKGPLPINGPLPHSGEHSHGQQARPSSRGRPEQEGRSGWPHSKQTFPGSQQHSGGGPAAAKLEDRPSQFHPKRALQTGGGHQQQAAEEQGSQLQSFQRRKPGAGQNNQSYFQQQQQRSGGAGVVQRNNQGHGRFQQYRDPNSRDPQQHGRGKKEEVKTSGVLSGPKSKTTTLSAKKSSASSPCHPDDYLEQHKSIDVLVSHVESPQCFWIHIVEQMAAAWPALSEILQAQSKCAKPVTTAVRKGEIYLCEFLGELSRARVVSVCGSSVRVFYMDFGNTEDIHTSKLLQLPEEIADWPALSVRCSLQVSPSNSEGWPAESVAQLQELFGESVVSTLTVLKKSCGITRVTLVRKRDGLDAALYLVEKGFAIQKSAEPRSQLTPQHRVMVASLPAIREQLEVGQTLDVVLLDTTGPLDMCVQIQSLEKGASDLSDKMAKHYSASPEVPYKPVVGELVMGRFSFDNSWCRAEVQAVDVKQAQASLLYVDYGDKEQLPFTELRAIKPEFAAMPIQRVPCAVEGVSTPDRDQLNEEQFGIYMACLQKFLTEDDDKFKLTMHVESIRDKVAWVSVVSAKLQQTLTQMLNQQLGATQLPRPSPQHVAPGITSVPSDGSVACKPIARSPSMPELEECSPAKSESVATKPVTSAALMTPPAVPLPVSSHGSCPMSDMPDLEECSPNTMGETLSSPMSPMTTDVSEQVAVMSIDSPVQSHLTANLERAFLAHEGLVACAIQEIVSCQEFYITQREAEEEMNQLQARLNRYCGGQTQAQPEVCTAVVCGSLVLVQFTVDDEWYRGRVTKVSADRSSCTVFFVDFGNTENKRVSSLMTLPPEFMVMPSQAICCKLAGVPPPVSDDVELKFKNACLQTEVSVRVTGRQEDKYFVQIFTADNLSITSVLGIQSSRKRGLGTQTSAGRNSISGGGPPTESMDGLFSDSSGHSSTDLCAPKKKPLSSMQSSASIPQERGDGRRKEQLTLDCLQKAVTNKEVMENVMVTHVVHPGQFYGIDLEHYVAQHQEGGLVPRLQTISASAPPLTSFPQVGDLLCGLFEGEWFRCGVSEIVTPKVRVNFFDYGNEAVLDLSDLRLLPKQLCDSYPLATFRYSVYGVVPRGKSWDDETVRLCKELLENQPVSLTIQAVQGDIRQAVVTNMTTGDSVGQSLLDSGRARRC